MNIQRAINSLTLSSLFAMTSGAALAATPSTVTFRIDVQNVTAGNVLSPFLAFVTTPDYQVTRLGDVASAGVAALAETGNRTALIGELTASSKALPPVGADGGPVLPGEVRSTELTVPADAIRDGFVLNVLAMIGHSNDSFIRVGNLPLAKITGRIGDKISLNASNFDAGSEENSGNVEDFGAGGHPIEAAEGHISIDRGLNARGNAPEIFAWGPVAAVVSITRIK